MLTPQMATSTRLRDAVLRQGPSPGAIAALVLLLFGGAAALAMNPARDAYGIMGDESTYVAMALSLANEGDFRFDRRDLQRFYAIYGFGPEGIFLKKGAPLRLAFRSSFPFVAIERAPERAGERLYFGKAFIYGIVAAPFVALASANGLFLMNVALLALVVWLGYLYLAARGSPRAAIIYTVAFFGASCAVVYTAWLTPEILNLALVFVAYFCWLYKEAAPQQTNRWVGWLWTPRSDFVALVLLALATYSKPPNGLLFVPIVVSLFVRRRWWLGFAAGACFVVALAASFGFTAVVTGDPNYQGGERNTFYGTFPFQTRQLTFETAGGVEMATNDFENDESFERTLFWPRFRANAWYFVSGRHFGFLPYFFPGVVAIALYLWRPRDGTVWQAAIAGAVAATALWFVVKLPFSWSGGGGPVGNRYFLSIYPAIFFLLPPLRSAWPSIVALAGGVLFIGHILVQPVFAAKHPWVTSQRGLLRMLPVELTMPDDLPVRLRLDRARLSYGDPQMLLYLVDENAFNPEPAGVWIAGRARADVVVRSEAVGDVQVRLVSPVANDVVIDAGRANVRVHLEPDVPASVRVPAKWVQARFGSAACLLSVTTSEGFVPRLSDPASSDSRFLGVLLNFTVGAAPHAE
jgi:hypothetical protein